jgi:hypothetical protein
VLSGNADRGNLVCDHGAAMARVMRALIMMSGILLLAGCQQQGTAGAMPFQYPAYDESNPNCGALGNCPVNNRTPYPMRGNVD